jgi:chitin synthase
MPGPTSIYHLWKAFDINSNIGGARNCRPKDKYGVNLLNPLVTAQDFEYKMSNIPLRAFSVTSLSSQARIATTPSRMRSLAKLVPFTSISLARRCMVRWYIHRQHVSRREAYSLLGTGLKTRMFVEIALRQVTDVPDQVLELISQWRRCLNGSFLLPFTRLSTFTISIGAAIHSYASSGFTWRWFTNFSTSYFRGLLWYVCFLFCSSLSSHLYISCRHIIILHFQSYLLLWKTRPSISKAFTLPTSSSTGLLIMCFIFALGNRPQSSK